VAFSSDIRSLQSDLENVCSLDRDSGVTEAAVDNEAVLDDKEAPSSPYSVVVSVKKRTF